MTIYRNITILILSVFLPFLVSAKQLPQGDSMFMIQANGEMVALAAAPTQLLMGEQLVYEHVYDNIDLVVYPALNLDNEPVVRYEFVVFPGGNPAEIVAPASGIAHLEATQELGGFESSLVEVSQNDAEGLNIGSYEQAQVLTIVMELAHGDSIAIGFPKQN